MLAATGAGAVPGAIFIHDGQSTESYIKAFSLLKTNFPKCFGGKTEPEVFMIDHSSAEKGALLYLWEKSLQFLCHFHVGQSEWRWLLGSKHGVSKDKRRNLMTLFQKVMYAVDTEQLEDAKAEFRNCGHEKYIKHVESMLKIQKEWVKMFRDDILHRGHNTNNYAEATIRILQDIILCRTKAFNVTALVDFIATVWEQYFESKLLHFAYGHRAAPRLKYEVLIAKMPEGADALIEKIDEQFYLVPNAKLQSATYEVDRAVGWCSCPAGRGGAFCKHQALVHRVHGGLFPNHPAIDATSRWKLGKLALGERCPAFSFFIGLKENIAEETETHTDVSESQHENTVQEVRSEDEYQSMAELSPHEKTTSEENENNLAELFEQFKRINQIGIQTAKHSNFYETALSRLVQRLKRVNTPGQASALMLSLSVASNRSTRRCGVIKVQPTAISRRREGATRGCKRTKAGRPPVDEPLAKKQKRFKLPRRLQASINANKSHFKKH